MTNINDSVKILDDDELDILLTGGLSAKRRIEHGVGVISRWDDATPPLEIMSIETNDTELSMTVYCDDGSSWQLNNTHKSRHLYIKNKATALAACSDRDHFYCLEGGIGTKLKNFTKLRKIPVFAAWSVFEYHTNGGLHNSKPYESNCRPSKRWPLQQKQKDASLQELIKSTYSHTRGLVTTTPVMIVTYRYDTIEHKREIILRSKK